MGVEFDNTVILAMVRSALWMFYLVLGLRYLLFNPKHEQYKYVLGCLLLIWSLELLKDTVTQFFPLFTDVYARNLYLLFDIFVIPVCAIYVLTMTYRHWLTCSKLVYNLLPFVCGIVAFALTRSEVVFFIALAGVPVVYAAYMIPFIMRSLRRYGESIDNNYSYCEGINIKWLKTVVWLFAVNLLFCIYLYSHISAGLFLIYYAYCLAMWCYIIWCNESYHRPQWTPEAIIPLCVQDAPLEPNGDADKFKNKLKVLFDEQRIFLKTDLVMQEVAQRLGTNRTYLSRYLNHNKHVSFYEYVNSYRLAHAERLLLTTSNKIKDIAQDSGFNSFSTFTSLFRRHYGCTPTEYRLAKRSGN